MAKTILSVTNAFLGVVPQTTAQLKNFPELNLLTKGPQAIIVPEETYPKFVEQFNSTAHAPLLAYRQLKGFDELATPLTEHGPPISWLDWLAQFNWLVAPEVKTVHFDSPNGTRYFICKFHVDPTTHEPFGVEVRQRHKEIEVPYTTFTFWDELKNFPRWKNWVKVKRETHGAMWVKIQRTSFNAFTLSSGYRFNSGLYLKSLYCPMLPTQRKCLTDSDISLYCLQAANLAEQFFEPLGEVLAEKPHLIPKQQDPTPVQFAQLLTNAQQFFPEGVFHK